MKLHEARQSSSRRRSPSGARVIAILVVAVGCPATGAASDSVFADAQRLFYNGRYEAAEVVTPPLCKADPESLPACELLSSTLLFEIKRSIGRQSDKKKAWAACDHCPGLMSTFRETTVTVREAADADGDLFVRAETGFALWEMQVREGNIAGAIGTAHDLAGSFPENQELRAFLAAHEPRIDD